VIEREGGTESGTEGVAGGAGGGEPEREDRRVSGRKVKDSDDGRDSRSERRSRVAGAALRSA
jgi:hypothetical protein